jgi:hypothetical protein
MNSADVQVKPACSPEQQVTEFLDRALSDAKARAKQADETLRAANERHMEAMRHVENLQSAWLAYSDDPAVEPLRST